MIEFRWIPHVLSIELKKAFSYRVTFWVQFFMGTGTDLAVAYFLWQAIFAATGKTEMGGFSFHGLVYYSLFASFSAKITRGSDRGYVSQDIYEGTLTRYLLYPLPFFPYKFVTHFTQQLLGMVQMLIALSFVWFLLGDRGGQNFSLGTFAAGVFTCLLTGYLHFVILSCIELVAFWQDVIWNLMAMFRFTMMLLGGGTIPLTLFPEWGRHVTNLTPFPSLISFPARTFLGQVGMQEWLASAALVACWSLVFTLLLSAVWSKGIRQYSGVGI